MREAVFSPEIIGLLVVVVLLAAAFIAILNYGLLSEVRLPLMCVLLKALLWLRRLGLQEYFPGLWTLGARIWRTGG